ncbi:MAG: phosphoribosylaminoimidazolesuccinocarboxamide synthase [Candidatus Aerophobetes bacterium]|nr:phosphoribosylaminoimidazolesuccinocarboxamide synthase [Candidatus Aerophobetes bacterium]
MSSLILKTDFPGLRLLKRGKVRDIYEVEDKLLLVTTDRVSAFDCVLPDGIPYKGKVLTGLSEFWFNLTKDIVPNHLITIDENRFPRELISFKKILEGRAMLVKKTEPIRIECVARGYLTGSAYSEYKERSSVVDIKLPRGLKEADCLPEPIFTPATKASEGHDVNISMKKMGELIGDKLAKKLRVKTLSIYKRAQKLLKSKGIILSDTKLEFGIFKKEVILIDELLTPDSSRFWLEKNYKPGYPQISFDKQFLRNYLESINWNKTPPAPALPSSIIKKTSVRYLEAFRMITGEELKKNS